MHFKPGVRGPLKAAARQFWRLFASRREGGWWMLDADELHQKNGLLNWILKIHWNNEKFCKKKRRSCETIESCWKDHKMLQRPKKDASWFGMNFLLCISESELTVQTVQSYRHFQKSFPEFYLKFLQKPTISRFSRVCLNPVIGLESFLDSLEFYIV